MDATLLEIPEIAIEPLDFSGKSYMFFTETYTNKSEAIVQKIYRHLVKVAAWTVLGQLCTAFVLTGFAILSPEQTIQFVTNRTALVLIIGSVFVTLLLACLVAQIPSLRRIDRYEVAEAKFEVQLDQIEKVFRSAWNAERNTIFRLSREYEAVKERILHLTETNDGFEVAGQEIIELIAKMSYTARHAGAQFSDQKLFELFDKIKAITKDVERAEDLTAQIQSLLADIRKKLDPLESRLEQTVAHRESLIEELVEVLKPHGIVVSHAEKHKVVPLSRQE